MSYEEEIAFGVQQMLDADLQFPQEVHYSKKPVRTNADHIRYMTDEELAKWLVLRTVYQESAWSAPSYLNFKTGADDTLERAIEGTADWLKQPYGGDT